MKKTSLLLAVIFAFTHQTIFATQVSVADAQLIARNFFLLKTKTATTLATPVATLVFTQQTLADKPVFYVFDMAPAKGFVIVAADNAVIPILGYSTEGNFNANFTNTPFNGWVRKTTSNIGLVLQNHITADERITAQWDAYLNGNNAATEKSTAVAPLVTTTWDQENDISTPPPYIYNLLCPFNNTDNQRCLTGCVATAQAQVMKYWNYPATGAGSFSYTDNTTNGFSNNYGTLSSNFASHTYGWSLMPSVLTGSEPLAQDSAVDVLMYDCAVSVGMDFGDDNEGGSGANAILANEISYGDSNSSQYALVKYFGYDPDTIKGVFESSYTASSWTALIEHELNVGRPVIYEGDDASQGGHAWVCDGYDVNNNLHMNWGWSGFDNGFFAINNLTTSGNFNPIQNDDALIGILPKHLPAPITNFYATQTSSCSNTIYFSDFSQGVPTSWLWNFGDGTTSTQQNPAHSYSANGTYTVTLTATNAGGSTPKTITNYITITMLAAPTASNVSAGAPQSFSLSASGVTNPAWFDSNGTPVSTSNPFVTPVLNTTTTYWVEDSVISSSYHTGALSNQIGAGAYGTDPYALMFNVNSPCVVQSVYVYAQNAGNRTIEVLDSTGHTIAKSTVYCAAGGARVTVNLSLNAGGTYLMQVADTLGLYNNTAGAVYPYSDSAGLVTITGNTAFDAGYYYFYDWVVKSPDCTSARVPVTASILTSITEATAALNFNVYPNPAKNTVTLQTEMNAANATWSLKNILGQTMLTKAVEANETAIDVTSFSTGVYLVELQAGEQTLVKKLVIQK